MDFSTPAVRRPKTEYRPGILFAGICSGVLWSAVRPSFVFFNVLEKGGMLVTNVLDVNADLAEILVSKQMKGVT